MSAALQAEAGLGGLSEDEAARRLVTDGPNRLAAAERRSPLRIAADASHEPMFLLLVAAALLYLILGKPGEGLFLGLMVLVTLGLTLYQEGKTEHALEALRQLASPRATVIRDGVRRLVSGEVLVAGDLVAVAEGDRVPADAVIVDGNGVQVDESLLSGESLPVDKKAGAAAQLFGGTLVVQGHAIARVAATGARSQIGVIGMSLRTLERADSPLRRQAALLARRFAMLAAALSTVLVLLLGVTEGHWLQALLAGIALAMSLLPEELPVVMTVFPAIGAWRLAQRQVLTRRLAAIETLGAVSVLCVDKTGTLTENRMAVVALQGPGDAHPHATGTGNGDGRESLPAHLQDLLGCALLASAVGGADPMDRAIDDLARGVLPGDTHGDVHGDAHGIVQNALPGASPRDGLTLLHEYGVNADRRALTQLWRRGKGADDNANANDNATADAEADVDAGIIACAKGAPETIGAWCRLDNAASAAMLAQVSALAIDGWRVLAVARARLREDGWPDVPEKLPFRLLGLVALADPLRSDIAAAVSRCQGAGIRLVMITGDHPATARGIARQAGLLADSPQVVDATAGVSSASADVSKADLSKADVSKADVSKPDVSTAGVSKAALSKAGVSKTDVSRPDVSKAAVSKAAVSKTDVSTADVSNADVSNSGVSSADLSNGNLANGAIITGEHMAQLDDHALAGRLAHTSVCARIAPGQKLRLVQALIGAGAVVAMTGDGVNDAPALKAAHVGIAMGRRGTDVAREAAALVLLDDRFTSIVEAIEAGRRIYDNLRNSMRYIFAIHAPIAGMALIPVVAGWPPLLFPMHIVFMELIIDPACSLVFENEAAAPDLMRRAPRDPARPLFSGAGLARAFGLGIAPLLAVTSAYGWAVSSMAPGQARAFGFSALVMANLGLIALTRGAPAGGTAAPNRVLWLIVGLALASLLLALYVPALASIFQFAYLAPPLALLGGAIGLTGALAPRLLQRAARWSRRCCRLFKLGAPGTQ